MKSGSDGDATQEPSGQSHGGREHSGWAQRGGAEEARGWAHAALDVLTGPDRQTPRRRLLSPMTLLRLVGPGSAPLAFVLMAINLQLVDSQYDADVHQVAVYVATAAAAVVLARYWALSAWVVTLGSFAALAPSLEPLNRYDTPTPWPWTVPLMIGYLVVQFAVGRERGRLVMVVSWVLVSGLGWLEGSAFPERESAPILIVTAVLGGAAGVLGAMSRSRAEAQRRLEEEEQTSAEERARREMLEERARIARELHDVVAHHMSVIAVQSSTATYRLGDVSEEAANEFASIADQARESLTEMRRLLGVLRSDESAAETTPQSGLAEVEQLAEASRRAGTPVELTVRGVGDALPAGVDLTGYRIVQESLSNVVRHAPGATATVDVHGFESEIVIWVRNTAPSRTDGNPPSPGRGVGQGLRGMRERVAAVGGDLSAGPLSDGGFEVRARLPLTVDDGDTERVAE